MRSVSKLDLNISRREVYRYLGCGKNGVTEAVAEKTEACIAELIDASELRGVYERFSLQLCGEGRLRIGAVTVESRDLAKNLAGCEAVFLMGATIGTGVDRLIARASVTDLTAAAVYQAAGAAYIEAYCDGLNGELEEIVRGEGKSLRPRFSPGYGDFPLDYQRDIFRLLNLSKHTGISLGDSLVMSPSKSVTAVVGIADGAEKGGELPGRRSCGICDRTDCAYREE